MVDDIYKNIKEIKKEALADNIPIMQDETIDFITDYIEKKKVRTILEIGTAVGYSAIMMAASNPLVNVVSIEKDKDRYIKALKNIKKANFEDRITLIFNDALDVKLDEKFDLIIIDAAKSKNLDFFSHFEKNLEVNGSFITDNINFHGYVDKDLSEISSKNIRGLVKKIRNYVEFLQNNVKYKTKFYDLGDGISVTERRI
ncbi:MAG: O-methyltransferase [Bacilli bacterium]|nr:O-methyltransferase [Bacilli bacterium]